LRLTVRLADGQLLQLTPDMQEALYDRLWRQTQRGSILAALKLRDAQRQRNAQRLVQLTEQESASVREALRRLQDG
jgi:hypothetical protein